mmetsp:Transcript_13548/g.28708  ORF Transcript_13548/g.28708 Transcript_13548/m.28708 type:complete len:191 (+) Transcript_13548:3-575(+)
MSACPPGTVAGMSPARRCPYPYEPDGDWAAVSPRRRHADAQAFIVGGSADSQQRAAERRLELIAARKTSHEERVLKYAVDNTTYKQVAALEIRAALDSQQKVRNVMHSQQKQDEAMRDRMVINSERQREQTLQSRQHFRQAQAREVAEANRRMAEMKKAGAMQQKASEQQAARSQTEANAFNDRFGRSLA